MEPVSKANPKQANGIETNGNGNKTNGIENKQIPLPKSEGIMDSGIKRLLDMRISQFHPDADITRKLIGSLRFKDREMSDQEKLKVLAICRCYAKDRVQRTLVGYASLLSGTNSDSIDLSADLLQFRTKPETVRDVNKYSAWGMGRLAER